MGRISAEKRREIVHKWCTVPGLSLKKLAKEANVGIKAVRVAIKKYGEEVSFEDLPRSGRKKGSANPKLDTKIKQAFAAKKGISVRDLAKKLGTSKSNVDRAKGRLMLKTYKKQKQPKRTTKQAASVQPRARKLYDTMFTGNSHCILMDDETYVKLDYKTLPGPQYYTVREGEDVDEADRSIFSEKFGKKVMVWQAICSCGKYTKPFIVNGSMNADVYVNQCLKKYLLPLIRQHEDPVIFWPDLASCHYANLTLNWYKSENVNFVPKHMNPPNCPEIRPIERFWALMKAYLRKYVKPADTVEKFKKDWIKVSKIIADKSVQNLMKGVRGKVRKLARK